MSYQPKTGAPCACRPGRARDNCPDCEGTGWRINFAAIRARPLAQHVMTRADMKLGGPGLDGYAYCADVYCIACAHAIIDAGPAEVPAPLDRDSDTTPQPIFFGEADSAQHCGECGEYLYGDREVNTTTCAKCGQDFPDGDMIPLDAGGELCPGCAP